MLMNGVWGALIEVPEKRISPPFPTTLGYVVWSLTFIPIAIYVLHKANWNLQYDFKSIAKGMLIGLLGAGGQFVLFEALKLGPAYIIFPITSVYPLVTIILSLIILKERANVWASAGVVFSFVAILLLSLQEGNDSGTSNYTWLWLSIAGFFMWGFQSFFAKAFLKTLHPESVFFYIMVSNLVFIPLAWTSTDFTQPIGWTTGLYLTIGVQALNVLATLLNINALKKGKVIIISPMSALAPMITTVLSLIIYAKIPYIYNVYGIVLAMVALALITYGEIVTTRSDQKIESLKSVNEL